MGFMLLTSYCCNYRFITMDESFLLENRSVLRAMYDPLSNKLYSKNFSLTFYMPHAINGQLSYRAELGIVLIYFYVCDRTNVFPESKKVLILSWFYVVSLHSQHIVKYMYKCNWDPFPKLWH
jgi:hypothetical protein